MKTLDRVLAWALLAFGLLHTLVGVVLMSRKLNPETVWFFGGGLALIFGAFLNFIRTHRRDRAIARTSFAANLLLLVLAVLFCWVLRHNLQGNPQAAVFVPLVAAELILSGRQWSQ